MFKLEINTDNAAFADGYMEIEIERIMQKVINCLNNGETSGTVRDINGNPVGKFELK